MNVDFLLFKDFETLDAMGPAEVFGEVKEYGMRFFSPDGGITKSVHGVPIATEKFGGADHAGILMIPGGFGVRALMKSPEFLEVLGRATPSYEWVLTVCTGSALLAATGLLDGREATSNKMVVLRVIKEFLAK